MSPLAKKGLGIAAVASATAGAVLCWTVLVDFLCRYICP